MSPGRRSYTQRKCKLCKTSITHHMETLQDDLCPVCDLAVFIIDNTISVYMEGTPEDWIRNAMQQFGWIAIEYPEITPYLKVAREVVFEFAMDGKQTIDWDSILELRFFGLSPNRIITVLEEACIVENQGQIIRPGVLLKDLILHRMLSYDLHSPEFEEKMKEISGVLAVAILRSLLYRNPRTPQRLLAPFRILAQNILNSGLEQNREIETSMSLYALRRASRKLTNRQVRNLIYQMAGVGTTDAQMIKDLKIDGSCEFTEEMLGYMYHFRNRYRDRLRNRVRLR